MNYMYIDLHYFFFGAFITGYIWHWGADLPTYILTYTHLPIYPSTHLPIYQPNYSSCKNVTQM